MSLLVLGSYLKDNQVTKVLTNLICLIGGFEIFIYSFMLGFAIYLEEWTIFIFTLFGLVSLVGCNIMYFVYYRKEIDEDQTYKKWLHYFPNTGKYLPVFCLLVNFKCCKMLYSGFFGLESTLAQFHDTRTFFNILKRVTFISFALCYISIFIADIIIFVKISWCNQLLILGIESFILQILMIILTLLEFRDPTKLLLSNG